MTLGELARIVPIDVVRDGEFRSIGLLSHRAPLLLGCLYDRRAARECRANPDLTCVLTTRELATEVPDRLGLAVTAAPAARLSDAQRHLGTSTDFFGSHRPASIAANASVHASATVAPRNVVIGAGCIIEAGAVVLERSVLEDGVVIRAGAVIGAEGFHPIPHDEGIVNLSHCGGVHLGPGVQVLSGAVVCRSTFGGTTEVGARTILGPLVYVAHGVSIGTDCRIAAASRVSGSTAVGHRVYVGPGAVISNGLRVGDDARVSIGAVVVKDVPAGATVSGHFAVDHSRFMSAWRRLFK